MKIRWSCSPRRRQAVLLGLLAVAIYLPGFWWGAPHANRPEATRSWGVDDESPLGPVAQVYNIVRPQEMQNLGYPLMHYFMTAAVYTPYLGYLWARGQLRDPGAVYPYGFSRPEVALTKLTWIAHLLSVVLGAGVVIAVFLSGAALWDERSGRIAALFALTAYPMFYYSRTANVDVPALFFIAAALTAFARILVDGLTVRRAIWLGLFAGFAIATKEGSAAAFLPIPFVILMLAWRGPSPARRIRSPAFWHAALAGVAAAILAFGLGSGLFVDPGRYLAHLEFMRERAGILQRGEIPFVEIYPRTLRGQLELAGLLILYLADTITWPGLLLALIGLIAVTLRSPRRAAYALTAVAYLLVLMMTARTAMLRYLLPAALPLVVFGARAVTLGLAHRRRPLRWTAVALAGLTIGLGLLRGADLTHAMVRDSRYAAARWLDQVAGPGSKIEFFGQEAKLPRLPDGVVLTRAAEFRGAIYAPRVDPPAVAEIVAAWEARQPDLILTLPEVSSAPGVPHAASCPPEIYARLLDGSLGYRLAAEFQTRRLLPWLPIPTLDYPTVNPPIRAFARTDAPVGVR